MALDVDEVIRIWSLLAVSPLESFEAVAVMSWSHLSLAYTSSVLDIRAYFLERQLTFPSASPVAIAPHEKRGGFPLGKVRAGALP